MRRSIFIVILMMTMGFKFAKGQENFYSVGTVFSLPVSSFSDYYDFGVGFNARFESGITEKMAAGFGFELMYFNSVQVETIYGSYKYPVTMLTPAKVYFRYCFIEQRKGPYVSVNIGVYPMYRFPKEAVNVAGGSLTLDFGWGQEIGVFITEQLGIALACDLFYGDSIFVYPKKKSSSSYFSLRTFANF